MWILFALLSLSTFAREMVVYTSLMRATDKEPINSEIFLQDLSSGKKTRLTHHKSFDYSPTLHPSGKLVAYVTDRFQYDVHGDEQIMLKDLSTGKEVRLDIGTQKWAHAPIFSQDGKYLYYSVALAPLIPYPMSSYRIMRYVLATQETEQVTPDVSGNFFDLAPSPDGSKLAFRFAADGYQFVRVMDLERETSEELFPGRPERWGEMRPSWRSNREVTMITDYGIHEDLQHSLFVVPLSTKAGVQLPTPELIYDYHAVCWFNETKGIMAAAEVASGTIQLFAFTGDELTRISEDSVYWSSEPDCRDVK